MNSRRAVVPFALALLVAQVAQAAPPAGPYEADLAARNARWQKERARPEGALALLGVLSLWDWTDPAEVTALAVKAAGDRGAHPLARAYGLYQASSAVSWRGDGKKGAAFRRELGLLGSWRVIGPFGFEGGDLVGTPYGPEGEGGLARAGDKGKRGEVAWRDLPEAWLKDGVVPLGALLRPDTQAAAYALTWVNNPKARDLAVRVGTQGAFKVWIGGQLAAETKVKSRGLALDQDAGVVRVEAGWTPVLVKVAVEDGGWNFILRLTEPGGAPLVLESARALPSGQRQARASASKVRLVTLRGALDEARARARTPAQKEAAVRDLAVYHEWISPEDPETKPIEAVLDTLPWADGTVSPQTLLVVARHAESTDKRRRAADLLAERKDAPARLRAEAHWRLGLYYGQEAGIPRQARSELVAALTSDASFWPAAVDLAETLDGLGLPELAVSQVSSLLAVRPHAGAARRSLARLLLARGRPDEARAQYEMLVAADGDDVWALGRLADLARNRGEPEVQIALLRQIVAARPTSVSAALTLAETLRDHGDVSGALAALDAGLLVAPDDARLLEDFGRTLIERGGSAGREEGIRRLKHALVMRPQNPELRRYLEKVSPTPGDDLEKQYARDVNKLREQYKDWEKGASGSVVLLDLKAIRVHENGLSETYVQKMVRIQDETGADAEKWQGVQFSPDTQTVEVRVARVLKASGEIVEAKQQGVREVSEPWYSMYYDIRADMTGFERLEPGDVVEYSYVLSDAGRRNLYADYFGDVFYFAGGTPQAEVEYTLIAPASRNFNWRVPELARLVRKDSEANGERTSRFLASKVAKVQPEGGMPGWTEASPYLHVSTWKTWDQVARWYWRLVEEQLVADEAVRSAAKKAVAGLEKPEDKVRAIHNLAVKSTRYVALEFGIHSFKPYRVPTVYERRFGDCKDKASLIVVLLREVGIPAQLILIRTRRNGDVDESPASLALFDHAIAYVPSLDLYLDGTAEFSGSSELPWGDQGVMVLRIDGGDGLLTRTPVLPASDNLISHVTSFTLAADGSARFADDVEVRGQLAAGYRQHYQAEGDRLARYEKQWNGSLPGVQLDKVSFGPGVTALEQPVTAHTEGKVPQLGAASAGGWSVPVTGDSSELTQTFARTSKRQHDLLLDYPFARKSQIKIHLPAGAKVSELPRGRELTSPFGRAKLEVKQDGGVISVSVDLAIQTRRVKVKEYPAFRDFLGSVDDLLSQPIEYALP